MVVSKMRDFVRKLESLQVVEKNLRFAMFDMLQLVGHRRQGDSAACKESVQ